MRRRALVRGVGSILIAASGLLGLHGGYLLLANEGKNETEFYGNLGKADVMVIGTEAVIL